VADMGVRLCLASLSPFNIHCRWCGGLRDEESVRTRPELGLTMMFSVLLCGQLRAKGDGDAYGQCMRRRLFAGGELAFVENFFSFSTTRVCARSCFSMVFVVFVGIRIYEIASFTSSHIPILDLDRPTIP
jgi:hypothetical protein